MSYSRFLLVAAVLPGLGLCSYIYKKDPHKEPKGMLAKIFIAGFLSCIPIIIFEIILGIFFPTEDESIGFVRMFINVFISVALVEEGFKWLVTKLFGYRSKDFDEIYDVIVYAVFASLGFACIENILYVFSEGIGVAILRALISVPGHACDGVIMGYFMGKQKVCKMNGNHGLATRNLILSLLVPTTLHAIYDALLFAASWVTIIIFFVFVIAQFIICFLIVKKMSKVQQNVSANLENGSIQVNTQGSNPVIVAQTPQAKTDNKAINFCPVCGTGVAGLNYCPSCGYKVKKD